MSGVCGAISASNTGGAWDNAKKYIEQGKLTKKDDDGKDMVDDNGCCGCVWVSVCVCAVICALCIAGCHMHFWFAKSRLVCKPPCHGLCRRRGQISSLFCIHFIHSTPQYILRELIVKLPTQTMSGLASSSAITS